MDTMIRNLVKRHRESVSEIRRRIHRRPELSNEEEETAALVKSVLEEAGIEVRSGVGGHGVVGLLRGGGWPCGPQGRHGRAPDVREDGRAMGVERG